jgi:hypothetical protein
MKHLILILSILYFIPLSFSQITGYLGKKISIEADINILPRFTDLMMSKGQKKEIINYKEIFEPYYPYYSSGYAYTLEEVSNNSYKPIKINLKSSLSLNYTISRKVDLCLRSNFIKANFLFRNHDGSSKYNITSTSETVPYSAFEVDLNIKIYRKNFIAPVGKYITFGIGQSIASTINNRFNIEYLYYSSQNSSNIFGKQNINEKVKFIKYNIGIGEKKVFKNNLYFKYELESNFYSLGKYNARILADSPRLNSIDEAIANIFAYNVGRNLSFDNILNLKIGFGIIL